MYEITWKMHIKFLFFLNFIFTLFCFTILYWFLFGCAGSSLLCTGFRQWQLVWATLQSKFFSSWWFLLLWSTGSGCASSVVVLHGLRYPAACGICPGQGLNLCPLHWELDSYPLCHQWKWKLLSCVRLFATPGQNAGVSSLSLLQGIFSTQGLNPGVLPFRRILPAEPQGKPRNAGVGSLSFSSGSSQPRNRTGVSCIAGRFFTNWARQQGSPQFSHLNLQLYSFHGVGPLGPWTIFQPLPLFYEFHHLMLLKCFLSAVCYDSHKGDRIAYKSILALKEPRDRQGREVYLSSTAASPWKGALIPNLGGGGIREGFEVGGRDTWAMHWRKKRI